MTASSFPKLKFFIYRNRGKIIGLMAGGVLRIGLFGIFLGLLVGSLWDELLRERRIDRTAESFLMNPSEKTLSKLPKMERRSFLLTLLGTSYFFLIHENSSLWESVESGFRKEMYQWLGYEPGVKRGIERIHHLNIENHRNERELIQLLKDLLPPEGAEPFINILKKLTPSSVIPDKNAGLISLMAHSWGIPLSPDEDPSQDYSLLGLSLDVSDDEVKQTFRALAAQFHPDTGAGLTKAQQAKSEEAFMRIRKAYERICRIRRF